MPTATPTIKRNPIPAGEHLLVLVSVTESQQPSFNNPAEMATRWIWQFRSKEVDPDTGERFEYREYTGPAYGNPKARMTWLMDQLCPDWDDEDKANVDTETLTGKKWIGHISNVKNQKNEPGPKLMLLKPYVKPKMEAAPPPAPASPPPINTTARPVAADEDDDPDPFADE